MTDKAQLLAEARKWFTDTIVKDLLSVQPMDVDIKALMEAGKSTEWLKENGYEPVSGHGLLWVKKENPDGV